MALPVNAASAPAAATEAPAMPFRALMPFLFSVPKDLPTPLSVLDAESFATTAKTA